MLPTCQRRDDMAAEPESRRDDTTLTLDQRSAVGGHSKQTMQHNNKMKNIKHLLTLLALIALGLTARAQSTIVQNEGDLRNALSNNSVTYIDLRKNITIENDDDLVVSSDKVINLVGYDLTCYATHIRVASGGLLVIYSEVGGRIIGRSNMDGRAIYIDNNGSCTI